MTGGSKGGNNRFWCQLKTVWKPNRKSRLREVRSVMYISAESKTRVWQKSVRRRRCWQNKRAWKNSCCTRAARRGRAGANFQNSKTVFIIFLSFLNLINKITQNGYNRPFHKKSWASTLQPLMDRGVVCFTDEENRVFTTKERERESPEFAVIIINIYFFIVEE